MTALLHWLYANVAGNMVASAILAIPAGYAFLRHHLHVRNHLRALHTKMDALLGEEDTSDRT